MKATRLNKNIEYLTKIALSGNLKSNGFGIWSYSWILFEKNFDKLLLRVVQTQTILFLKSISERDGSDIERLWNWASRSTQNHLKMTPFKFRVVQCRIRLFPTLISKIKWLGSRLPLTVTPFCDFLYDNRIFWLVYIYDMDHMVINCWYGYWRLGNWS